MFVIKSKKYGHTGQNTLNEANEKALTPVRSVHISKIFALLHVKAILAAQSKFPEIMIENTAAAGNGEKNATFHSAGEHMICARSSAGNDELIKKSDAFGAITEYVKVFLGPDIVKKLKESECFALTDTAISEGLVSFKQFMDKTSDNVDIFETDEDNDGEDGDEDNDGEDGDEDNDGEDGDEDNDGEDGDEDNDGEDGDEDPHPTPIGEDPPDPGKVEEAKGFYMLYGLKVKGLKETTAADALKQWGSNFIKGFGITLGSMWGGGSGEVHTIGGLIDGLKEVFGGIYDPDELCQRVQDKLTKTYPKVGSITCEFRDKKTLVRELDKSNQKSPYLEGWPDGKNKQKINSAEYSMYIHVEDDDLKKPYINRKVIANVVTMQIKGLYKKFKHMIKADDIIYIKGKALSGNNSRNERIGLKMIPSYLTIKETFYTSQRQPDGSYNKMFISDPDELIIAIERINERFNKASADKSIQANEDAKKLIKMWQDFYNKHSTDDTSPSEDEFKREFLGQYRTEYNIFYKKYKIGADDDSHTIFESNLNQTTVSLINLLFESADNKVQVSEYFNSIGENEASDNDESGESGDEDDGTSADSPDDSSEPQSDDSDNGLVDTTKAPGDDLYIIPMPGVKYKDPGDDEWKDR